MSASTSLAVRPAPLGHNGGPTIDAYPGDETKLLAKLIGYFESAELASLDEREMAEKCRDYFDGRQWTPDEMRVLRARHQPASVDNYVKRKIELLAGLERRGRSDPKAYPRTPTEDNRADAATQALRYVMDDQRYDVVRSSVFDNILIEGMGGCEVVVERDKATGGYNVVCHHLTWDRLFRDPHSAHPGFTDAKFLGICIWSDREDMLDEYPGCEDILSETFDYAGGQTYGDKPTYTWSDARRRRVRVVQIWWKLREDWWTATFTHGGFLESPSKSPYLDRHGNATCPLILRSAYCDRDLQRYGVVKDMISPQDNINKRLSKLMHLLSVNQVLMEEGAAPDVDLIRAEAAKPDGVLVYNKGFEFKIIQNQVEIEGQFKLLQHAIQQMNVTGPNASMAGKDPREQSGRAIIAQQAGGQMEHEPIADALRQHTHKVAEAMWMRIKQFWTEEKWIRVTDSDKTVKFVGLNHPVTIADLLGNLDQAQPIQMQIKGLPKLDAKAVMYGLRLQPNDPRLQTVVKIENDVNDMDVDITVEEGPDNPTMQAEQFQTIMQLPIQILQQFPPAFIIKASSLRNKDELIKMLDEHQQAQARDANSKQALETGAAQAQIAKTAAQAKDIGAQTVERLHGMALDHSAGNAPPDNALMPPAPAPLDPLAVDQQYHAQTIDKSKLALAADQQAHDQAMDVAGHALAVHQAMTPPAPPAPAGP